MKIKMMTKEIERALSKYPIYSQDGLMGDAKLITKYFDPCSQWTWYVTEGERRDDGDWEFFGLVCGHEWEWGYFLLSQITEAHGTSAVQTSRGVHIFQLPLERDIHVQPGRLTVAEAVRSDGCGHCTCPEHLIKPRAASSEEPAEIIEVLAVCQPEAAPEPVSVGWARAPGVAGQQTLF